MRQAGTKALGLIRSVGKAVNPRRKRKSARQSSVARVMTGTLTVNTVGKRHTSVQPTRKKATTTPIGAQQSRKAPRGWGKSPTQRPKTWANKAKHIEDKILTVASPRGLKEVEASTPLPSPAAAMSTVKYEKDYSDPRNWKFINVKEGRACEWNDPEGEVERRWWPMTKNAWEYSEKVQAAVWQWVAYASLPQGAVWKQWAKNRKSKWGRRNTAFPFKIRIIYEKGEKITPDMISGTSISDDLSSDSAWSWSAFEAIKASRQEARANRRNKQTKRSKEERAQEGGGASSKKAKTESPPDQKKS